MLTTDDHADEHHHNGCDDDEDVAVHYATATDGPTLLAAFREAVHAVQIAREAFDACGIGPDQVVLTASLTDDGQPLVLISATRRRSIRERELRDGTPPQWWLEATVEDAGRRTNAGGGAGGPPEPMRRDAGWAA